MSDPSLSVSSESLLSRISELERTVEMLRRTGVASVAPKDAPSAVQSESAEEAENTLSASVKSASLGVEAKQARATPIEPSSSAASSESAKARVLRPLRGWAEIVERMMGEHPMYRAMLGDVKAYGLEDGTILLRFPNPFTMANFEQLGSREKLRGELSYLLKRDVKDRELVLEVAPPKNGGVTDLFDEIVESAENGI